MVAALGQRVLYCELSGGWSSCRGVACSPQGRGYLQWELPTPTGRLGTSDGRRLVPYLKRRRLSLKRAGELGLLFASGDETMPGRLVIPEVRGAHCGWMVGRARERHQSQLMAVTRAWGGEGRRRPPRPPCGSDDPRRSWLSTFLFNARNRVRLWVPMSSWRFISPRSHARRGACGSGGDGGRTFRPSNRRSIAALSRVAEPFGTSIDTLVID